jgi:hypothetical protein
MDVRQRRASDGVVVGGARVVLLQLPRNVLDEVRDVPVLR